MSSSIYRNKTSKDFSITKLNQWPQTELLLLLCDGPTMFWATSIHVNLITFHWQIEEDFFKYWIKGREFQGTEKCFNRH